MKKLLLLSLPILLIGSCRNRDINASEEFKPRVIHDFFEESDFSVMRIDGLDYIMLEKDNNNPHEGFGFMALKANKMMMAQDSVMAYLKAMNYYQLKMYSRMMNQPEWQVRDEFDSLFLSNLRQEYLLSNNTVTQEEIEEQEKESEATNK